MTTEAPVESVREIGKVLQDKTKPLKDRFRALFTLKNLGGSEAIDFIASCFDDGSALLKHELAYCLGQMQDRYAVPSLISVLEDKAQEAMVRHEAGAVLLKCVCDCVCVCVFVDNRTLIMYPHKLNKEIHPKFIESCPDEQTHYGGQKLITRTKNRIFVEM